MKVERCWEISTWELAKIRNWRLAYWNFWYQWAVPKSYQTSAKDALIAIHVFKGLKSSHMRTDPDWTSGFGLISKLSWMVLSPMNMPGNCLGTGIFHRVSTWVSRCNDWMAGKPRRLCWSLLTTYIGFANDLSLYVSHLWHPMTVCLAHTAAWLTCAAWGNSKWQGYHRDLRSSVQFE